LPFVTVFWAALELVALVEIKLMKSPKGKKVLQKEFLGGKAEN